MIATDVRHGREIPITRDSAVETEEQRVRVVFELLGGQYGDRAQTAIRYALANPDISCVIIGLAELDHLEKALAAEQMGPLPATAIGQLHELYGRNFR